MTRIMLLAIALAFFLPSKAQDVTIENISSKVKKFRGVQAVENLGYYCFVLDEKSQRGYKFFNLHIWDYDLNEIAKATLELEKKSHILDAVYNGSHFMVAFYDAKKDNVRFVSFDLNGTKVADVTADGIKTKFMMVEDYQPSFFSAGDNGFYVVIPDKEKKFGYSVSLYSNDLKEQWVKAFFPEKGVEIVMDGKSNNDMLVLLKYSKASRMTKIAQVDMTAFSAKDGSALWTYDLSKPDRVMLPTELAINEKGNIGVAGMYFDGIKIKGMNSDGIFFAHVGSDGKELAMSSQPWDGELQKFLKESKQSMTVGKPKVIFEDIIYEASTGQFKLVGEIFTTGTLGKVLSMLSRDVDAETKITIEDIVVFTFGSDGTVLDLYAVNKARTNVYIPTVYAGGLRIATALKQTGSLPFKYTSLDKNGDAIAFYIDKVKLDDDGNLVNQKLNSTIGSQKTGVGMLNLNKSNASGAVVNYLPLSKKAGKIDEKSDVDFDSKRSIISVTESKPGFVLISQFSKPSESLNLYLEEIK